MGEPAVKRAWDAMIAAREDCIGRLEPEALGRWSSTDAGRRALARAAWESGWDSAVRDSESPSPAL